jgi:hypothetical protein
MFFISLKKIDERKYHNMFALMLDLRYKNLRIVSTFVGNELGVDIVEEYDKKAFSPMLLKTHQFLHPLATFESMVERASDENFNLDIFQMSLETSEPSKEFVR